ncbi:MAG TPA: ATP-binding protein [Acetobacteraceae bacterium]|nr:ATP-binding protein [Acetobacteraceae bacterium]
MASRPLQTLQARLLLLVGAVAVPLLLLAAGAVWYSRVWPEQQADRRIQGEAQEAAWRIDGQFEAATALLQQLAAAPASRSGDLATFRRQVLAASGAFHGAPILLTDAAGRPLVDTACLYPDAAICARPAGWIAAALRRGDSRGGRLVDAATGRPVIGLVWPLAHGIGAALGIELTPDMLAEALAPDRLPAGWSGLALDAGGAVVARADRRLTGLGQPADAALMTGDSPRRSSGVRRLSHHGEMLVVAVARAPRSGLTVLLSVPAARLTTDSGSIDVLLIGFLVAGLVLLAAGLGAAVLIGQRVCVALRRLAAGEMPAPSLLGEVREVHDLGMALAGTALARDQVEEQLRQLNDALESQVAEEVTARERAQVQLAQAQKMQALGQLAGGVAHDVNNVLQAISGAAALLQQRSGDPGEVQRLSLTIGEATERGASVTRRLLAFARRSELRAEPVCLVELLGDLREVLRHTLGINIRIVLAVEARLPAVLADRGQLETVLVNLATNARDALPPDGGTIAVSAGLQTVLPGAPHAAGLAPGRYVALQVTDDGAGMSPSVLARACEPFFTTKPAGSGTGLGLAMARGFAEQSGGGLEVVSTPGRGTRVTLWLPLAPIRAARHPAPVAAATQPVAAPALRPEPAARVLIVDDEPVLRGLLAEELAERGYTVEQAEGGGAALAQLRPEAMPDVLITDLAMPGMDGRALIRAAQDRRPDLPAILLTGHAGEGAAGETGRTCLVLHKPIPAAQLAERIAELLRTRRAAAPTLAERAGA